MGNIHTKIHEIMKAVEYLQKDDAVSFGKTAYKAITEEKVTSTIRREMVRLGVIMYPEKVTYQRSGNLGQVHITYRMLSIDDGSSIVIESVGEGADTQDKASGKAQTYAFKYAFLRTFAIPTGDDPDKISSDELDKKMEQDEVKALLSTIEKHRKEFGDVVEGVITEAEVKAKKKLADMPKNFLQRLLQLIEQKTQVTDKDVSK